MNILSSKSLHIPGYFPRSPQWSVMNIFNSLDFHCQVFFPWDVAPIVTLFQRLAYVLCKGPDCKYFAFAGRMLFITVTQFWCGTMQTAINNMEADRCGCAPVKLYLQEEVDLPYGSQFASPA